MRQVPLLFLSDNPSQLSGLGRITRDLAVQASSLPEFRVGVMGRGGSGTKQLPFTLYPFDERRQWGEEILPYIWNDFAGRERGIIMTIWDPSRLLWFSQPGYLPSGPLKTWLTQSHVERWGYFPIDSTGPANRLGSYSVEVLKGYNRLLAYTIFGSQEMRKVLDREIDWIPHGLNLDIFKLHDPQEGRKMLGPRVHEHDLLVGCVMTNQARKDWGLAFETISMLRSRHKELRFWCHADSEDRYWNLTALAKDYGVAQDTLMTFQYTDTDLAKLYSACDITILPSLGEGFGYPIVESLACGTPVVHGFYGGGSELIPWESCLVRPVAFRTDTRYNVSRPCFRGEDWARAVDQVLQDLPDAEDCRRAVEHLDWKLLWPATWKKWFLEGLR